MQKVLTIAYWACMVIGSILGAAVIHLKLGTGIFYWDTLILAISFFVATIVISLFRKSGGGKSANG